MKAKFLEDKYWYELTFKAGEIYDLSNELYARLLRAGSIVPVKDSPVSEQAHDDLAVGQPEKPIKANYKPVVTAIKPLPDLVAPAPAKSIDKPAKRKQKHTKMGKEQNPKPSHAPAPPPSIKPAEPKPMPKVPIVPGKTINVG